MEKVYYTIDVEKGFELSTKTIINLILKSDCAIIARDKIVVRMEDLDDEEKKVTLHKLKNIAHVNSVMV
jgi:hypothetical protein